jgi:hypothetical protein
MLRASILHFDKSWDKCLSLAEFSYNNSYQASLKMAPFDALYGRRYRTPLNWSEDEERTLCRIFLPGSTALVGTRTDYSVGPWDYPTCATRHLVA